MGWTYTNAMHYTEAGAIDRKAEVDALYTWQDEARRAEVVRSRMVGATYYAAVKTTDLSTGESKIFAAVALTHADSRNYCNFGVKTMDEACGPREDDCPASILALLSPTDSKWALEWRERCRKKHEAKKDPNALKNLPIGAKIRFVLNNGNVVELCKHEAAYQFKRPFWMVCSEDKKYMPVNRIPSNYEVVTA